MALKEADFTRDSTVSWHAIEEAPRREGVERIALSPSQVQMLTNDLLACLAGRKRADESAFRVPPTAPWHGLTCGACYGPACMQTESGRAYCREHAAERAPGNSGANTTCGSGMVESLRKSLLDAETRAEQNRALAQKYRDSLDVVEQERDAMALALARKEIAK